MKPGRIVGFLSLLLGLSLGLRAGHITCEVAGDRYDAAAADYKAGAYEKARDEARSLYDGIAKAGPGCPAIRLKTARLLGRLYRMQGDFETAISMQLDVLHLQEADSAGPAVLYRTLGSIGLIYARKNDHISALSYLERATELCEEAHGSNSPQLADMLINQSKVWWSIGNYDDGGRSMRRAFAIIEGAFDKLSVDWSDGALFMADFLIHTNEIDSAQSLLVQIAQNIVGKSGLGEMQLELLNLQADLALANGDTAAAQTAFLKLFAHGPTRWRGGGIAAIRMGHLQRATGRWPSAEQWYRTALRMFLPEYNGQGLPQLDSGNTDPWIVDALEGLGYAMAQQPGPAAEVMDAFELAVRQAILVRRGFASQRAREGLTGRVYPVFESAIATAIRLGQPEKALGFSEASKAAEMLDHLAVSSLAKSAAPLDSLIQEEKRLLRIIRSASDAPEARELGIGLAALRQQMADRYPGFYRAQRQDLVPDLARMRAQLHPAVDAVVEYFYGDKDLFVFVLRRDTLLAYRQPLTLGLRQACSSMLDLVGRSPAEIGGSAAARRLRANSALLYQALVRPWEALLPARTEGHVPGILLIPDGPLALLPFDAFLRDEEFLIQHFRFSFDYSLQLHFLESPNSNPIHRDELLFMGVSFESGERQQVRGDTVRARLGALPGVRREMKAIRRTFKGHYLLDAAAQKVIYFDTASSYGILHFSTHAFADTNDLSAACLVLAPGKEVDAGYLYGHEILTQPRPLGAELVALSACRTAEGVRQRGEGINSLGRAFRYAGSRATLTTRWELPDAIGADITMTFYRYLAEGMEKAAALRQAKLDYLGTAETYRERSPYNWAAFVLHGDIAPVQMAEAPKAGFLLYVAFGAALLALAALALRRRARAKR